MTSKVLICPYFGTFPDWFEIWWDNARRALAPAGFKIVLGTDEDAFKDRVRDKLGIEPPPMFGTGNIWDFRPAFGILYADEISDADFWGHTDFDCVYGRVDRWLTDDFLYDTDIFSNHATYVCGPLSLYRNQPFVNGLYAATDEWRHEMTRDGSDGWIEKGYSDLATRFSPPLRLRYRSWQTRNWDDFSTLTLRPDGALMEGDTEVMMAHFRRTKEYPAGCVPS